MLYTKNVIQPHIDYCITVWSYAPDVHYIDKVQRLQNRAVRIVSGNYDWTIRGIDIVQLLNWQTVREKLFYVAFNVQVYGRYSTLLFI